MRKIALRVGAMLGVSLMLVNNASAQTPIQRETGVTITIQGETVEVPQVTISGGGGRLIVQQTIVIMKGFAYPKAIVTITKNRSIVATLLADAEGKFEKQVLMDAGLTTIGVWAKDALGRNSSTSNVTIVLQPETRVTIADVVVSPTVSVERNRIRQGRVAKISGSTFPEGVVRLFNNFAAGQTLPPVRADRNGSWEYTLETKDLQFGEYSLKANSQLEKVGLLSSFSDNINFDIQEGGNIADLNGDNAVDIVDLSILLYNWQKSVAKGHPADLNGDGRIGLSDFSILMYNWSEDNQNVA